VCAEGGRLEWIQVLPDGTVHVLTEKGVVPGVLRMPENEGEFMDVCEIDLALCTDTPADSAQIDMNSLSKNPDRQAPVGPLLAGFTLLSAFVCFTFLLAWSVYSLSTLLNSRHFLKTRGILSQVYVWRLPCMQQLVRVFISCHSY